MDEEMQNYFERLAHGGVNLDENTHIELAKSSSAPIKVHREEPAELKLEDEISEDISSEVEGQLTIDVYQTPDEIVIESTIAGVKPEDLDINITSETVTIRGERKRDKKISDEDYFYQECYWGKFSRSIILPQEIDPEKSTATLKNGILTIRLPKLNRHKGRSLKIKFE